MTIAPSDTDDTVTPVETDDTVSHVEDDQDAFEKEFFSTEKPDEDEVPEDNPLATDEPDNEDESETDSEPEPEPESDESDDEEDEEEDEVEEEEKDEKPKKNRKSFQERINELTRDAREAERREAALRKEFEEYKASLEKKNQTDKSVELRDRLPEGAPSPDALGEDGEPIYPMGEFDPNYIQDLARFTIKQETEKLEQEREVERQQAAIDAERQKIVDNWQQRVVEAEKEIPELRQHMQELTDAFANLDPGYGDYLATTIMVSEAGPQLMEYLSKNIGEAQSIVASGPAAATLSLGRLEAKLLADAEKKSNKSDKKVSNAPTPPDTRTRGAGGRFEVSPDTDDQDAFERLFFK